LEEASSSCERWAWASAGLVIVGVFAEFVIAIVHPSYDAFFERWGSAFADALIAIGVGGEVLFSMIGARCQTELRNRSNKKVAEAVDRAAQADLARVKLESQLAARTFTKEQFRLCKS
jgi:hypothetical protein